MIYSD
jgi:hypothetical protein